MAASPQLSILQYLNSAYDPDRLEVSGTPIHLELQYLRDRLNPAKG